MSSRAEISRAARRGASSEMVDLFKDIGCLTNDGWDSSLDRPWPVGGATNVIQLPNAIVPPAVWPAVTRRAIPAT
ncbi:MAG: hypothetical protein ACREFR_17600, partial [Limisphaerales bacterium]